MPKILVPTDFSDNASQAIDYALLLFGKEAEYQIVNTFEVPHSGLNMLISVADILEKDSQQLLEDTRSNILKKHPDLNGKISTKPIAGTPIIAIKKLLNETAVDVVVMGTKGATGLKEVLVGSVTANLFEQVDQPVIAVPESAPCKEPKKILVTADDQLLIDGKLPPLLEEISKRFNSEITILNVVPEGELAHVGNADGQHRESVGSFEGLNYKMHYIENDNINTGINDFIDANDIDLVSMLTRKTSLFSRLFGTSNTRQSLMHTRVPLLAFH